MEKKTVLDVQVSGKKVLVRCDFNVPLDEKLQITDDTRIRAALPTIKYLMEHNARVILCSHLGRPKGEFNLKYSLKPVAERLSEYLGKTVPMASDVIGDSAKQLVASLKDGEVMLLENVRFHPQEDEKAPTDPSFTKEDYAKALASMADLYVNDAFGTAHRAHASTEGVTHYLPAVAGFLIEKELQFLDKALQEPERPFLAILGGSKVSDKIGVIKNLLTKVDVLLIGGGMAYTFQKAMGGHIGNSLCQDDYLEEARNLLATAAYKGKRIVLPVDNEAGKEFSNDTMHITVHSQDIPDGFEGMDIGPVTREMFCAEIARAKTIVWNGPMGVAEFPTFEVGTRTVAQACADNGGTTIIGGGDSAAAVTKLGFADRVTHISTGGGASLEFLEGKKLPGIEALNDK